MNLNWDEYEIGNTKCWKIVRGSRSFFITAEPRDNGFQVLATEKTPIDPLFTNIRSPIQIRKEDLGITGIFYNELHTSLFRAVNFVSNQMIPQIEDALLSSATPKKDNRTMDEISADRRKRRRKRKQNRKTHHE